MILQLKFLNNAYSESYDVRPWLKGDVTTPMGVWVLNAGVFTLAGVGKVLARECGAMEFTPEEEVGMNELRVLADFGRVFHREYATSGKPMNMEISFFETC